MLPARSAVSLTKSLVGMNGFQMRTSAISGPPRVKVSFVEKVALGTILTGGVVSVPAWVLLHLGDYRGEQ